MMQSTIGLDVSKDTLDAYHLERDESQSFTNSKAGHKALIAWINEPARLVYEPTGPYHRAIVGALAQAEIDLVEVNPRRLRRFADVLGVPAKTDCLDARLLARMGQLLNLPARPALSETFVQLKALLSARQALVKDRTAAKNRQKNLELSLLKKHARQRLKQIERQINDIDKAIAERIQDDPELKARLAILESIPGLAALSASALLIETPELGSLNAKQIASLAGLAPITRQSGKWAGKTFINGGRASLRRSLYMPALVAVRYNPYLKTFYERLVKAGKPKKLALAAAMRKLIILANALLREQRKWQTTPP
ncbi:MAG: IS110 family transposase [Rhodospirillaceae bacterium]